MTSSTRQTQKKTPAALSLTQVLEILKQVDFEQAILVGGQAVLLYAHVYHLNSNKIELGISGDIDLIAKAAVAQALVAKIPKAKIKVASLDSHTINTAVIAIDLNAQEFMQIDCLREIAGLSTEDIKKQVQELELDWGVLLGNSDISNNSVIKLINPLHLLSSKLHNLVHIPSKRDRQSRDQAELTIEIARSYLTSLSQEDPESFRHALNAHTLSCMTNTYVQAHQDYGLDAFSLVETLPGLNPLFIQRQLPVLQAKYAKLVHKHKELLRRRAVLAKSSKKARQSPKS